MKSDVYIDKTLLIMNENRINYSKHERRIPYASSNLPLTNNKV